MPAKWIDISVPLHSGMVHWPSNPPVHVERILDIERGDKSNVSALSMGSHTGTHMDAPIHFIRSEKGIDQMPLDATIGRARVIEIRDEHSVQLEELRPLGIRSGERILFKTKNSARCWKTDAFTKDFVYLSKPTAQYLAERRVQVVGVDYLSVGGFHHEDSAETHRVLLKAGIWIIEGLDLSRVRPGEYELICLPLRIAQGDGAPARAIVRAVPHKQKNNKERR
jgi:arylformamidase